MKNSICLILICVCSHLSFAQEFDGYKGFSGYQRYDDTFISPDRKGKHSLSLGATVANVQPVTSFVPEYGAHLGYNYIIYWERERLFGVKEVKRDEVRMGFGAHFTFLDNGEYFLTFNYLNPLFSLRGKLFSLYFLGEYGLGIHKSQPFMEDPGGTTVNMSLEALRLRFGASPLHLHLTAHYDVGKKFLSQERMNLAFLVNLRYYIYKRNKTK